MSHHQTEVYAKLRRELIFAHRLDDGVQIEILKCVHSTQKLHMDSDGEMFFFIVL